MGRVIRVLHSTMTRQALRLDLTMLRVLFVVATVFMLWAQSSNYHRIAFGRVLMNTYYPMSMMMLVYLAGRLNRETVGDATSGFLSLVYLTGIRPIQWTIVRYVQIFSGFFSVWLIRLPFLYLFFTMGGVRFSDLCLLETGMLFVFLGATSRSMLVSHNAEKRASADWAGLSTIFIVEFLLMGGNFATLTLAVVGLRMPTALASFFSKAADLTISMNFWHFAMGGGVTPAIWGTVILYSCLTVFWMFRYQRQLYSRIAETPDPALEVSKKERKKVRRQRAPLPRCWDDAIAWQSYVYYSGGSDNTVGRSILYALVLIVVAVSLIARVYHLVPLILLGTAAVLYNAMGIAAQCMMKECQNKTLSSLMLTPHSPLDLYKGWRKGMLILIVPDILFCVLLAIAFSFLHHLFPVIIASVMMAMFVSSPMIMLSHLVPVSWKGLPTGALVVFGIGSIVTIGVVVSQVMQNEHVFPFVAVPLFWVFNQFILKRSLASWMQWKVEQEA